MSKRASNKPKGRGLSKPPTPPESRYEAWIWTGPVTKKDRRFGSVANAKLWLIPQLNNELPTIEDEWGISDRWTNELVVASAGVQLRWEAKGYDDGERS